MERTLYHFYIETGEIHGRLGEPSLSMGLCEGREIYVKCQDVTPVLSATEQKWNFCRSKSEQISECVRS